jgi:hypothetical protein
MLRDDELNREIISKFSKLAEGEKAVIVETLIESLFEQAIVSFDRQSKSEANP